MWWRGHLVDTGAQGCDVAAGGLQSGQLIHRLAVTAAARAVCRLSHEGHLVLCIFKFSLHLLHSKNHVQIRYAEC